MEGFINILKNNKHTSGLGEPQKDEMKLTQYKNTFPSTLFNIPSKLKKKK